MKTIHESVSTPKADGYRMPGEFEPQTRIWMAWPHRTDTWAWGAKPAQKQYAEDGIDPEETNGHIDDVAQIVAPGKVLCIWSDDPDYPFYNECHAAYETLSNAVDAKGRKLEVTKLCMPVKPLYMDQASCDSIDTEEYAEPRVADEPLIASYMNFLIVNGGVIVPQYGDENDALAVQQIQAAFDEAWGEGAYKAVGVKTDQVVFGGGNIHCITQQEPAGK